MKNADLPAMPIGEQIDGVFMNPHCNGLTKREEFAKSAMMAILSNPAMGSSIGENDLLCISSIAFKLADALLEALEK